MGTKIKVIQLGNFNIIIDIDIMTFTSLWVGYIPSHIFDEATNPRGMASYFLGFFTIWSTLIIKEGGLCDLVWHISSSWALGLAIILMFLLMY